MQRRDPKPLTCDRTGCGRPIIFATRQETGKRVPYDPDDVDGRSDRAAGCHVITGTGRTRVAWRPPDLAEHWFVERELPSLEHARRLVADYPHHRPHLHLTTEGDPR
jgi:hypothetical protein